MKKICLMSLMALVAVTMMSSCVSVNLHNRDYDTTPTQVTEINKVTTVQPFDEVSVANAFKVIYEQGTEHSVRIEASEQAFKEMTVYVKDGELRIRKAVKKTSPMVSFSDVKVYVTSATIKDIDLAGSGLFVASNKIDVNNDLDIEIAGSGRVLLTDVKCKDVNLDIAGSGDIEIGNIVAKDADADIAGSGDINLALMSCNKFDIEIAGSGNVNCGNIVADDVHTEIAGSGNVTLKGKVKNRTQDIAGSGKVNFEELKTE